MATTMVAMDMLRTMMPLVHESDLEAALGDLRALCHKWNARHEYRLELAASEVDILGGKIPRVNRTPERGPALPWTEKTTNKCGSRELLGAKRTISGLRNNSYIFSSYHSSGEFVVNHKLSIHHKLSTEL